VPRLIFQHAPESIEIELEISSASLSRHPGGARPSVCAETHGASIMHRSNVTMNWQRISRCLAVHTSSMRLFESIRPTLFRPVVVSRFT
jgi:hypothetical protein